MNPLKKFIALLLSAALFFAVCGSVYAEADSSIERQIYEGTCGANLSWSLDTATGVLHIHGSGLMSNYYPTAGYPTPWHDYREYITSVVISNGAISIGNFAFYGCTSLHSVSIPNTITSIGLNSFSYCVLLDHIELPISLTSIGQSCFSYNPSLTSISIPGNVTSIGKNPFAACYNLTTISVSTSNQYFSSYEGSLFNKSQTELLVCPGGINGDYSIPDSVVSINDWAFSGCSSLTMVTLGNNVTRIKEKAFKGCSVLTSVLFLGAPPSEFGNDVFIECPENLCLYYTESHISQWAPNGQTTWNGYPIALWENSANPIEGDFDGSGDVNITDAVQVLRASMGLITPTAEQIAAADINGDDQLTVVDALQILRIAMGIA